MDIDALRFENTIATMRQIGFVSARDGINRLALSANDVLARRQLTDWLAQAGLTVRVDPIGNMFAIRPNRHGSCENPVMMGSHLDTVRQGGAFDGALGVLGALEVLRTLEDHSLVTEKPVGIINFTHEEGPRFSCNMMGSSVLADVSRLEAIYAYEDDKGISVKEALTSSGFLGTAPWLGNLDCYFELHIEQGPVLEREQCRIGVVEGVQGVLWYQCEYTGFACHAGPTPLADRRDSLLGAADCMLALRKFAESRKDNTMITVGRCEVAPNEINVIPGATRFTIDARQFEPQRYADLKGHIEALVEHVAQKHGLTATCDICTDTPPVRFDSALVALVEDMTRQRGYAFKRMPSGAGHDAQIMTRVCPVAMIFVPSKNGISHTPQEDTSIPDAVCGANVLLDAVCKRAGARQEGMGVVG